MPPEPVIRAARAAAVTVPLRAPYVLSFVTLEAVTARLIRVELDDGRSGLGEVVALPGYGAETDADVAAAHARLAASLPGRSLAEARAATLAGAADVPFAASAVLAALDVAGGGLIVPPRIDQPLVSAIATAEPAAMLAAIDARHRAGTRTIKVKFGRDAVADRACIAALLDSVPDDVLLRFDANQAYDEDAAARVLAAFDHPRRDRVELLEQPLGTDEASWDAFARLAASSPVPLMLDESIDDEADIDRAAACGATWIKLKACKGAGAAELLARARRARDRGLKVVLGNGVATDVANLFEGCVRAAEPALFDGAGEDNGFAKLVRPLLARPPRLEAGAMRWERGGTGMDAEAETDAFALAEDPAALTSS